MNNPYILLADDDKNVQTLNQTELEARGYSVKTVFTIAQARQAVNAEMPALIVLEIDMPDGNGMDFLREIRAGGAAQVPVLALSRRGTDEDVVAGFAGGCNDYLAKPYSFQVLFVRIKELLSRAEQSAGVITRGRLTMDKTSGRAYLSGRDLLLKPKEFALLLILAQNEGVIMSAGQLYCRVWNAPLGSDKRALQTRISVIRKKLEEGGFDYTVKSIYNEGYCFEKYAWEY